MKTETETKIAKAIKDGASGIAASLRALGTGDAATSMGAIEVLAVQIRQGLEMVSSSISDLASAIRETSEDQKA